MIVLDRDILVKLRNSEEAVVEHLKQYRTDEWTIPSHVAWESFQRHDSRSDMLQEQQHLRSSLDRILPFTSDTALEAAYLDEKLQSQGVTLDSADLLNLATAHTEGGTFITHNKNDFDKDPLLELTDVDVVMTE
ncbi:tRNA(fMet)-specific endonuclease VapC [Haloarcula quadrata]|uniref:tRNA(fMet)-specific endonuclease VapC n=1 Tax=Haloarcula quadrata TaxID=182779 RepID=A0A495RAB5_9EURY|nr:MULTISPECIES: type II toxin-antitoxin system VapC family toxin [Haloarcula]RKS84076.1 tRNA(fMet)-specific endonuclease VapC [Haloarcula quadrata]RLN01875.1 type II toxin-antitoxin system VapC family toxin [Haloarcula sp. Atlit-7R]